MNVFVLVFVVLMAMFGAKGVLCHPRIVENFVYNAFFEKSA
jgi:hypothetical protein